MMNKMEHSVMAAAQVASLQATRIREAAAALNQVCNEETAAALTALKTATRALAERLQSAQDAAENYLEGLTEEVLRFQERLTRTVGLELDAAQRAWSEAEQAAAEQVAREVAAHGEVIARNGVDPFGIPVAGVPCPPDPLAESAASPAQVAALPPAEEVPAPPLAPEAAPVASLVVPTTGLVWVYEGSEVVALYARGVYRAETNPSDPNTVVLTGPLTPAQVKRLSRATLVGLVTAKEPAAEGLAELTKAQLIDRLGLA